MKKVTKSKAVKICLKSTLQNKEIVQNLTLIDKFLRQNFQVQNNGQNLPAQRWSHSDRHGQLKLRLERDYFHEISRHLPITDRFGSFV